MPVRVTIATLASEDVQITDDVTSLVVPSLNSAMAVNRVEPPCSRIVAAADTRSEMAVALVTVKVPVPSCPPKSAVIVAVPGSSPVAWPAVSGRLLMVATDAGEDVHRTDVVRFCLFPSAKMPVATKANTAAWGMLAVGGETCIDVSGEPSTTMAQFALSAPSCAVIVAFPADCAVTSPPLLTLATSAADDVQVTKLVITSVLPSLYVPVATRFTEVVGASTALAGVTEIEVSVAVLTFSAAVPETPLKVAEMLAVPGLIAVAVPPCPTVATAGLSEAQVQSMVMTCLV